MKMSEELNVSVTGSTREELVKKALETASRYFGTDCVSVYPNYVSSDFDESEFRASFICDARHDFDTSIDPRRCRKCGLVSEINPRRVGS